MKVTELTHVMIDDQLSKCISTLIARYRPKTILEIGSSDGTGSTNVFINKLKNMNAELFCIEMNKDRYNQLKENTSQYSWLYPVHAASVDQYGVMQWEQVEILRKKQPNFDVWATFSMEKLREWYDNTLKEITKSDIKEGIHYCLNLIASDTFDMVFIDGGPFTAEAELDHVYGADIIILDDIYDIKNYNNYIEMNKDTLYERIAFSKSYRNGFAAYKLV